MKFDIDIEHDIKVLRNSYTLGQYRCKKVTKGRFINKLGYRINQALI